MRGAGEGVAVVDLDTGGAGQVDEGGVELDARSDGGEVASALGHRQLGDPAGRRTHPGRVDHGPRRHDGWVEAELLEQPEGQGGEAVAAALVPREARLVDEHHLEPGPGGGDGGGHTRRAGADDGDVGPQLPAHGSRTGGPTRKALSYWPLFEVAGAAHCCRSAVTWAGSWLRTTG